MRVLGVHKELSPSGRVGDGLRCPGVQYQRRPNNKQLHQTWLASKGVMKGMGVRVSRLEEEALTTINLPFLTHELGPEPISSSRPLVACAGSDLKGNHMISPLEVDNNSEVFDVFMMFSRDTDGFEPTVSNAECPNISSLFNRSCWSGKVGDDGSSSRPPSPTLASPGKWSALDERQSRSHAKVCDDDDGKC